MTSVQLIAPRKDFAASYRGLVREIVAAGEPFIPFTLGFPHDDFDELIATLVDNARGRRLPAGFVAHSTFWLVSGVEIVGVSNVRHALTAALRIDGGHIGYGVRPSARQRGFGTELLRLTLIKAGELGLKKVLLTCAKANIGSSKVILANAGKLASEGFVAARREIVQRYWIDLSAYRRGSIRT